MNVIHIYLFVCINCEQVIFMYLSRNTKTRRLSLHGLTTDISVTGKWRRSCGQKISAGGCRLTMNSFLCGAGLGCWAAGLLGWSHQARATWRGRHPAPRTTKPPLELQTKVRETFTNTEKTCCLLLVESAYCILALSH